MWKLKVLIQFILAKLPGGEWVNHLLQRLNASYSSGKAERQLLDYAQRLHVIGRHVAWDGCVVAEIGTGWDARSALLFSLAGAREVHTYDHIAHLRYALARRVLEQIDRRLSDLQPLLGVPQDLLRARLQKLQAAATLEELLAAAKIYYHAPGDAARTGLPAHSVDLVYSYAVLEHVPDPVVDELTVESKRILKPGGVAFHGIGLHDHYVSVDKKLSKVNFLRYPESWWKFFVKNSISYHNRLREKQFLDVFRAHGARIVARRSDIDPRDLEALKTMPIDRRFQGLTPEELAVYYSEVVLAF